MITDFFNNSCRKFPDKNAIVFENKEISYSELGEKSRIIANSLLDEKSTIVSILLPNSIDFVISYYGILCSNNTCHIISPSISDSNLVNQIEIIKPSIIISNSVLKQKLIRTGMLDKQKFVNIDKFEFCGPSEIINISNDLAQILFSAGTTSYPKAIKLSHSNIANTVQRVTDYLKITSDDIDILSLPLSHSFGLGCLNCTISCGGTTVLHRNTINMSSIFSSIEKYSATSFAATPTTFQQIIDNYEKEFKENIESIRYFLTNSSPMSEQLVNKLLELIETKNLYTYYGLTEASRSTFHQYIKSDPKIKSVGKPLPGVKLKIMSNGIECKAFEIGEIWINGPHVSIGYWINSLYDVKIKDEWLHTDDLGYLDSEGYLYLMGRLDDLINVGGEKVFPKEIEDMIITMNEIDQIAVKGVLDRTFGQIIKAFIVPKKGFILDKKDILNFCLGKIENYKIPKIIEFVDNLPRNEQGKILRNKL